MAESAEVPAGLDNYLEFLCQFVTSPSYGTLQNLRRAKGMYGVGEHGYCHPYAAYVDQDGVACDDGIPIELAPEEVVPPSVPACPLLDDEYDCRIMFAGRKEIWETHMKALETVAAFKERYPNWQWSKFGL